MDQPEVAWRAQWVWPADGVNVVNYHCQARKSFSLDAAPNAATMHISVGTDYVLFVNGSLVGRGPTPSDPAFQSFDSHDVATPLRPGENVVAVLCHNYGVGVHWQYGGPGGLIAQLELETPAGKRVIATDETWRMRAADSYVYNSPRLFWSCGFAETFDFRLNDAGWTAPKYVDATWPAAGLLPREIRAAVSTPHAA